MCKDDSTHEGASKLGAAWPAGKDCGGVRCGWFRNEESFALYAPNICIIQERLSFSCMDVYITLLFQGLTSCYRLGRIGSRGHLDYCLLDDLASLRHILLGDIQRRNEPKRVID